MTKLQFVGFNGYHQCPKKQSKIIFDWVWFEDDALNVSCSHRVIAVETGNEFKLYGILNDTYQIYRTIRKPGVVDCYTLGEDCLVAAVNITLWEFSFRFLKWKEVSLSLDEKDVGIWKGTGNRIIKISIVNDDRILLLSNGSVWKVVDGRLEILYPFDVDMAVDVVSGFEHSLILTESGCVLSVGNGSRGQLGNGDLNSTTQPEQISALEGLKIIKISAGGWHSCAITDSGDLCTWGWNNYGQLSAFDENDELGLSATPIFVDVGPDPDCKVIDVACGARHTIAKLENGDVYSTGWNFYHQLGIDSSAEKISKFTKTNVTAKYGKLFCGPWYSIVESSGECLGL